VDLPKDVLVGRGPYTGNGNGPVRLRSYNPTYKPHKRQLRKVMDLIASAKRPVIFAGGGVVLAGAHHELTAFAQRTNMPVTTTLMGLGAFPASDPKWLGMIGMHGTFAANMTINACDLMIAVGVRFDDRVTGKTDAFAAQANIVHIDIDPASIRKNIPVTIPVVADCKTALTELNAMLSQAPPEDRDDRLRPWLSQVNAWKREKPLTYCKSERIKPQCVVETLHRITEGKAIITTEVGQNQMWAAQFYHFEAPNRFITSGGLGCMGFGLPAAVGAQIAAPASLVVDIAGDGSIQMNIQEMATAVQYGLPVKIVILNNGYLGMVRQWQQLFYDRRYAGTRMETAPDFVKLAEAYGAVGLRAETPEAVEPVLRSGLFEHRNRPVIMDFVVEAEECVYPMVPAGAPITQMLLA
jgi:acetolactate synthase-1/2/3 large subunit